MFRRRGGGRDSLPTTEAGNDGLVSSFSSAQQQQQQQQRRHYLSDGSAKSIRVPVPAVEAVRKASFGTKLSYGLLMFFVFLSYFGYRHLRYSAASVWLTCHAQDCHLQLTEHSSWEKTVTLDFARRQLSNVFPVKSTKDGGFISANPDMTDPWIKDPLERKKAHKAKMKALNYKGPDENGHYLSYALVLRDKTITDSYNTGNKNSRNNRTETTGSGGGPEDVPETDLKQLVKFADKSSSDPDEYRLIIRRFRIGQSKRRVRMMVQKVESYIRKRRQRLVIKETAPPSWQGLVSIITGIIGLLLTLLLGQFYEERATTAYSRRHASHKHSIRRQQQGAGDLDNSHYQPQTPSRYEVNTKPAIARTGSSKFKSSTKRSGNTQTTTRRRY